MPPRAVTAPRPARGDGEAMATQAAGKRRLSSRLPPITTNLAAPSDIWLRLEAVDRARRAARTDELGRHHPAGPAGLRAHGQDAPDRRRQRLPAPQGRSRRARRDPQRRPRQARADQDAAVRMRKLSASPFCCCWPAPGGAGPADRPRRHRPGRRHDRRLHHPDVRPAHGAVGGAGPADHGDELHPLRHRLLDPARRHGPADRRRPT